MEHNDATTPEPYVTISSDGGEQCTVAEPGAGGRDQTAWCCLLKLTGIIEGTDDSREQEYL